MSAPPVETEDRDEPALESGPGRRLQEARRAANLSLMDVAAQLHLDTSTIEALEKDDYAHLPAPAFVRGYLRSYARLLNLAPGPVVNAYDSRGFEPPALVADISTSTQAQGESTDLPWRLMTYLVAAVVVTLVVLWWRSNMNDPFSVLDSMVGVEAPSTTPLPAPAGEADTSLSFEPRVQSVEPSTQRGEPLPLPGAVQKPPPLVPGEPAPMSATAPTPAPAGSVQTPAPPATAESAAVTLPAPRPAAAPAAGVATPTQADTAPATPASDGSGSTPAPAAEAAPQPAAGVQAAAEAANPPAGAAPVSQGTGRLDLAFTHDSWVEVYDADAKRLFFGMARAGRELSLEGALPLDVLLGYARDIRVEYNGRVLDYTPYVNRGIARFTLAEDGIRRDTEAAGAAQPAQ